MEYLKQIETLLSEFGGSTSFYYENLVSGERKSVRGTLSMEAASTIKIPVMISAFLRAAEGRLDLSEKHMLSEEEKLPSCGCLNQIGAGAVFCLGDLVRLMITLSDNTATNILIRKIGLEEINRDMEHLGYRICRLERLLFDGGAAARGLENRVCAEELCDMLKRMYQGELVNAEASAEMIEILKNQKLNGKIPFLFEKKTDIAHKTGEDSGITHDVGIVYGKEPYLICFLGNALPSTPRYNRLMQEVSWELWKRLNEA